MCQGDAHDHKSSLCDEISLLIVRSHLRALKRAFERSTISQERGGSVTLMYRNIDVPDIIRSSDSVSVAWRSLVFQIFQAGCMLLQRALDGSGQIGVGDWLAVLHVPQRIFEGRRQGILRFWGQLRNHVFERLEAIGQHRGLLLSLSRAAHGARLILPLPCFSLLMNIRASPDMPSRSAARLAYHMRERQPDG